jgi:hypothetical protein
MRSFFIDATVGALAYVVVFFLEIPLAMSKSLLPSLIGPAAFLVAGLLRGSDKGNLWAKSVGINLGNWCLMFWFLTSYDRFPTASDWRGSLGWILVTFVSTVCGIGVRRLYGFTVRRFLD